VYTCCMHFSNSRARHGHLLNQSSTNKLNRKLPPNYNWVHNISTSKAEVLYHSFTHPLLHSEILSLPVLCASVDHTLTHSHTHHIIVYADSLSHSFTADSPQHTCSCIIEVLRENTHTRIEAHCKGYGIIRPLQGHRLVRGCGLHHGQGEHTHTHTHITLIQATHPCVGVLQ
jgi:hypothetical protein